MLVQLTTHLLLKTGRLSEVTQPVSMAGANAVQYSITPFYTSVGSLTYQLQESQDLENWSDLGSPQGGSALYKLYTMETNVGSAYVRLKASVTAPSTGIVLAVVLNASYQSP